MKAPPFRYVRPATIDECLATLAAHGTDAQILAGGQSLVPMLNMRLAAPGTLIDINGLRATLGRIECDGDMLVVGALARHAEIAASPLIVAHAPLMAAAAPHIAHVAIRSRGTIGGSLALADPAAEWPACCLALGAEVELAGPSGRRRVHVDDYFLGLYETARREDEMVTSVRVPAAVPGHVCAFHELARRRGDFAIAGVAFAGQRDGRVLRNVRIAMMGVADRPLLARGAMAAIEGMEPDGGVLRAAVTALAAEIEPAGDSAYPAEYRRHVAGVLLSRSLGAVGSEHLHG